MQTNIRVTMSDGTKWIVPFTITAMKCAVKLSKAEGIPLQEAIDRLIHLYHTNQQKLLYELGANVPWEEIAPYARQVENLITDYSKLWPYAAKTFEEGNDLFTSEVNGLEFIYKGGGIYHGKKGKIVNSQKINDLIVVKFYELPGLFHIHPQNIELIREENNRSQTSFFYNEE